MIFSLEILQNISSYSKYESDDGVAILYIFFARTVNFLANLGRSSGAYQLSLIVALLEKHVGYADHSALFIQRHVLREKQLFYINYIKKE